MTGKDQTVSCPIEPSADFDEAADRFLNELGDWARERAETYRDAEPTNGHDQGTFTTGWAPWLKRRDDGTVLAFLKAMRDRIRDHFVAAGAWKHGYWRVQEPHHGTEHCQLFLGTLLDLDPADGETVRQIDDTAEHVGNWAPGIAEWYDWGTGLFRALHLGTEEVADEPMLNVPDHIRFANICLLAHRATGKDRYVELCASHLAGWTDAILESGELPVALGPDGAITTFSPQDEELYRSFVGALPRDLDKAVDRAENLLASDATGALLGTWTLTGDARAKAAAERVIDVLATQLHDPDAGAAAAAVRAYRTATGDTRYDGELLEAAGQVDPWAFADLTLDRSVWLARKPSGIGKRGDMLRWLEDGEERRCNPVTVAVAAEITGDESLASRALDLGRTYLQLARLVLDDGRGHGCGAKSISAVCRGHGRENHVGVTTGVLGPLLDTFRPV
jgi:hypothetical protein